MSINSFRQHVIPVSVIVVFGLLFWYCLTVGLNASGAIARVLPKDGSWSYSDLIHATLSMSRPILPPPPPDHSGYLGQPDQMVDHLTA
ncbi:hypothetical protein [uncultured Tolumonas sp.]|uniref:hypothetical protein n=1 Tax=uncultured Tolumonas sp. TaxID=263765 RepID=UPI002A0A90C4|nr:hypothetical protein [uncultured Tolumonas sp.]